MAVEILINVPEDQFAFASGVRGDNNTFGAAEKPFEDAELLHGSRIGFILLAAPGLAGFENKGFREDRQILLMKPFDTIGFGHGRSHKVPEGPCNGITVTFDIAVPADGSAHDGSDLTCHGGFFCYNDLHMFGYWMIQWLFFSVARSLFKRAISLRS